MTLAEFASYRQPNVFLLFTNIAYIAITVAIAIIGFLIVNEHADDFKANSAAAATGPTISTPCGLPTPDALRMLQALGELPGGGLEEAVSGGPDYTSWIGKIDAAVCSRVIGGVTVPSPADCNAGGGVDRYEVDYAEELLALAALMDDSSFLPMEADITTAATLATKLNLFHERACLTKRSEDGVDPFHSKQQRHAYGDFNVRITRAYLTAMPVFYSYYRDMNTCWSNANDDPFNSDCKHACHAQASLQSAAGHMNFALEGGVPTDVTIAEMTYRLLLLSLVGYHDRRYNNGACLKNTAGVDALTFCRDTVLSGYSNAGSDLSSGGSTNAMAAYATQHQAVHDYNFCSATRSGASPPPPPTPPVKIYEFKDGTTDEDYYDDACASTLQYGLFEQGRLLGIPDPTGAFVIDNRPDRSLHFFGGVIYRSLYVGKEKGTDAFNDPAVRLQLYMGYRLAGTTIWAMQTAAVAGYIGIRAAVPTLVFSLRLLGVKDLLGTVIVLMRPPAEVPVFLGMAAAVVAGYWMIWVDPASQSHYPITQDCGDWAGLSAQVPSGAYVTTWGRRRFDRNGEAQVGVLLFVFVSIFAFQQGIGRRCVPPEKRADASTRWTLSLTGSFWVTFLAMFIVMVMFAAQAGATGQKWYDEIKNNGNGVTLATDLAKDCTMAVYASFWAGGAVASSRQKWAIGNLSILWKALWATGTLALIWMPTLQASILLKNEWETAFEDGAASDEKERYQYAVVILAFSGVATAAQILLFIDVWKATPGLAVGQGSYGFLKRVKELVGRDNRARTQPTAREAATRIVNRYADRARRAREYTLDGLRRAGAFERLDASADGKSFAFLNEDANPVGVGVPAGVQRIPLLKFSS